DQADVDASSATTLDESASRLPNGFDSDSLSDFTALLATPGASNGACDLLAGDMVINEVVSDPLQDWDHDGAIDAFDGTPGVGVVDSNDEYIELANVSGVALDIRSCVIAIEDTSPTSFAFQGLDAAAAPYVRVFDDVGVQVGTADALDAVPAGGYVLLG